MWTSGRIADRGVGEVMLLLAARSSSGTLTIQGDDVLAVRFRGGEILGADALKESLTSGLGRILVAAGHLDRDQIATLEAAELEGSVIDHLLATGAVPAETLAGCVRQHTYLLLLRLLSFKAGDYHFYEGEVGERLPMRPLSVEEVLVRASEEDPRLFGGTIAPLGAEVLRPLLGRRAFRVLNWHQDQDPGATSEGDLWLTPFEDALLRSLDGLTPAGGFREILGVDEFRLRLAFHRLRVAGLVEPVGSATAPPAAAATRPAAADDNEPRQLGREPVAPPERVARPGVQDTPPEVPRATLWSELGGQLGDLSRLFSYTLAAGLASLVLVLVLASGGAPRLLHPFPWQDAKLQALESLDLTALHRDLIGRLKTYHILFGTFPLDLRPLVDTGLVRPGDLEDDHGREVAFEALDQGFLLGLEEQEEGYAPSSPRTRIGVAGDFLLDPGFVRVEGQSGATAVQVLD